MNLKWWFLSISVLFSSRSYTQFVSPKVIPTPSSFSASSDYLSIKNSLNIEWGDVSITTQEYAKEQFDNLFALKINEGYPQIRFLKNEELGEEEYSLNVDSLIEIYYSTESGAFYALTTLFQLIENGDSFRIPKVKIADGPRFKWRGLHLDVSRHFFSVDEVKRFIDLMALYKFNTFHWHLTDDQGWRIEIKKYPKLTEVGAYRDSTMLGHFSDEPRTYDREKYGGFYTQEQIKEVVKYARERFITVVPEIEMPGHSRAAIHAYPELSCSGVSSGIPAEWGIFNEIFCSKEDNILFLQGVLNEVIDLFPSKYIHVGGDEAPKLSWKNCETCQGNILKYKLKDEHELQSYFIQRMDQFLNSKGRKLIGWDEILEGGLSENASVMSWRGEQGGIEAAKSGHNVVMSPTSHCYFDYYQSSHRMEPVAIGGYLPLEKVYNFQVIPNDLPKEFNQYVLGGQGNLWTEYVADFKHVEYMVYPRALALIQNLWSQNKPSYSEFLEVLIGTQENYMSAHEIHFAPSIHYPDLYVEREDNGLSIGFKEADTNTVFKIDAVNHAVHFSWHEEIKSDDRVFIPRDMGGELRIDVRSSVLPDTFHFNMVQHGNLGVRCVANPAPHPKYNHNGTLNLVDGVYGELPWKGGDWLGFNSSEISLEFDLENDEQIEGIKIGFLDSKGAWIYLPNRIDVLVSKDGKNWNPVVSSYIKTSDLLNGVVTIDKLIVGRFIQLKIFNLKEIPEGAQGAGNVPWTFIDEVEFKLINE